MLEELFRTTADDDRRGYTLEVRVSNTSAIALYESLGFSPTGVRRGYYTDNREDALVMWKDPLAHSRGARQLMILGIETSCDETAAAVVTHDGEIRSNVVASQAELHARYGGVVPEIASRRHLELFAPVVHEALEEAGAGFGDLDAIAVTRGPGLIGALLVGVSAAKALAWSLRLPLVPVDHLHAHVAALYLEPEPLEPPFLALLASGGHTLLLDVTDRAGYRVLGTTLDDAAGEAFDKGARLLGLGYPGGAAIDRLAQEGDPEAFAFPVAKVAGHDFSFSGVKTALVYAVRDLEPEELERRRADLAASYQRAIVRALVERTRAAATELNATTDRRRGRRRGQFGAARVASRKPCLSRYRFVPITQRWSLLPAGSYRRFRILATLSSMRMPPRRNPRRRAAGPAVLALVAACTVAIVFAAPVLGAGESALQAAASAWNDVFGERPESAQADRMIVVLAAPSLADSVARSESLPTPADQKRWLAEAEASQRLLLERLAQRGVKVKRERTFTRTLNGFSAVLDGRAQAELERMDGIVGVYPVRTLYPAALTAQSLGRPEFAAGAGRRLDDALPGFDGTGVKIALLDSGVDLDHPYLGGRVRPGYDLVDGDRRAAAEPKPDDPGRVEPHGTRMAGILVGADGPTGLQGVVPGSTVVPIRILGWEQTADGSYALLGHGDTLLAGLERAVDPNRDGDVSDALADRARRGRRAVRVLPRQPRGPRGRRRGEARHARRRSLRERRPRGPRLRNRRRSRRRRSGADRRRDRSPRIRPRGRHEGLRRRRRRLLRRGAGPRRASSRGAARGGRALRAVARRRRPGARTRSPTARSWPTSSTRTA